MCKVRKSNKYWTLANGDYEAEYDEAIKYSTLMEIKALSEMVELF